jgi:hypothetical protein
MLVSTLCTATIPFTKTHFIIAYPLFFF